MPSCAARMRRRAAAMESIYLKTLVEVAQAGNITRAADSLHVTQSAVSRRIKFLEDQYGQPLIDRSGPLLSLTPAGRVVAEKAQKILEIERDLLSSLHLLDRRKGLSFVCTPTFGIAHLPEVLREVMLGRSELGDLKFVLDMPEKIVAGLKDGLYELGVVEHCHCFDLSEFDTVSLVGDEMVFAASPALRLSPGEVTLEALLPQTLYARDEGCCSRSLLEKNLLAVGREIGAFRRMVVYDDLHVIVEALVRGEGVAFISTDLVRAHVAAGRLREHRVPGFMHARKRTLVMNGRPPEEGLAGAFVKRVLARVGIEHAVVAATCA